MTTGAARGAGWRPDPALVVLFALGVGAALTLAFVTVAPNRLAAGRGVPLAELLAGSSWLALLPALPLALAALRGAAAEPAGALGRMSALNGVVAVSGAILVAALAWLAGEAAAVRARPESTERVAFGGAFWCLALLAWLAAADAVRRLRLAPPLAAAAQAALWLPLVAVVASGRLDALSLVKEWVQRDDVVREALARHLEIVGFALAPALLLGAPLGLAAVRRPRWGRLVFAVLSVVQTIPSIALFGLLIAPLAALGAMWPGSGIRGVGLAPALVALALYALLPIVQGVASGLAQVDAGVREAARGMGLSPRALLWRVEVPLALPLGLAALRAAAVQLVGLAVVAALIGAGGLGALVFQGLAAGALDLVLLGVVPVVALAAAIDAGFAVLSSVLVRVPAG